MAFWAALPAILGAVGLLNQHEQQRKANRGAADAQAMQAEFLKRRTDLQDKLMAAYDTADKGGQFDADAQIAANDKLSLADQAEDTANQAGALRVSGYRPGDSEIGIRQDAVNVKYQRERDEMRTGLRRQSFFDRINALRATDVGAAETGLQVASQNQARSDRSQPDWGGFFSSVLPFLDPKKKETSSAGSGFKLGRTNFSAIGLGIH